MTTPLQDGDLADAYRRAVASHPPASRAGCPSPEALRALAEAEGGEDARLQVLDHVMGCAACAPEFELLRAMRAAHGQLVKSPRRVPMWGAIAAGLVIVVGGGALVGRSVLDRSGADVARGTAPADVALLAPAVAGSGGVTFHWRSVPGAVRYDIELLDRGDIVFRSTTADTAVTVPDAAARHATDWWVRAVTTSGAERRSRVESVHVP